MVERSVLNHLATEIMMLKEFLPTVCKRGADGNHAPGVTMQLARTQKGTEIQNITYMYIYTVRSFE